MTREWVEREALITVKAYPNPSAKYHETVCVAAITKEEGWIRLYPVQFRSLPEEQRFKKYQRVRLRIAKHERDARPESYRLDENSIDAAISRRRACRSSRTPLHSTWAPLRIGGTVR